MDIYAIILRVFICVAILIVSIIVISGFLIVINASWDVSRNKTRKSTRERKGSTYYAKKNN